MLVTETKPCVNIGDPYSHMFIQARDLILEEILLPTSDARSTFSCTCPTYLPNARLSIIGICRTIISMILPKSRSTKKVSIPRLTTSNPDLSLDYVEELLYISNTPDTTSDL